MSPEEIVEKYKALNRAGQLLVNQLNVIFLEKDELRNEYKKITGKEMLIN